MSLAKDAGRNIIDRKTNPYPEYVNSCEDRSLLSSVVEEI